MDNQRSRVEEIFHEVLERGSSVDLAVYLDQMCGDDGALREEVEALLAARDGAAAFFAQPVLAEVSSAGPVHPQEGPGTVVGRYKLLQEIGEGGFGVVYMAEQQDPIMRKVALKIIKLGMDTRQVVARFEAERQALALMDHPNIAQVHDAGATENGRPYFVMELVRGVPVTEYCDQNRLSTDERLQLFIEICNAVQHAHQKGIIHRDIKPTNVLVTIGDGRPMPKVIDFGIAKATRQRLTEKTLYTDFHQFVGTPQYMSPEQATMSDGDVDTRTDVYSLGVLLYELLVGRTPFGSEQLRGIGYDEICRIIREDDPPAPSRRFSTLAEAVTTSVSRTRQTHPAALRRMLRGELDWIVMKALEKDRSRRYATANDLAADVRRYLSNEAVEASHPSAWHSFRRFARRNKVYLVPLMLVAASLLVGAAVSISLAVSATKERQISEELRRASDMTRALRSLDDEDIQGVRRLLRTSASTDRHDWEFRYLYRALRDHDRTPTFHHQGWVGVFALSPDGLTLVSGDTPGNLNVWDVGTGIRSDVKKAHRGSVINVEFSHDGKTLVSSGGDNLVRIWTIDPATRQLIEAAQLPSKARGHCTAVSPDGERVACGGDEDVVRVWKWQEGEIIEEFPIPNWRALAVKFSPDGNKLAAHCEHEVLIWDLQNNADKSPLEIPGYDFLRSWTGLVFSPNSRILAASWRREGVQLVDVATGEVIRRLMPSSPTIVNSIDFSPDGKQLAAGDHEKAMTIWNVESGEVETELVGHHSNMVSCVRFTPDGSALVSSSMDKTVRLWPLNQIRTASDPPHVLVRHGAPVRKIAISSNGLWLATAGRDDRVLLWDVTSWSKVHEFEGSTFAFSPSGSRIAIRDSEAIDLWDVSTRSVHRVRSVPAKESRESGSELAFLSEGVLAVVADTTARLWNTLKPTSPVVEYTPLDDDSPSNLNKIAFDPNHQIIAAADLHGDLALLDSDTLVERARRPEELAMGAWQVTFSPDGNYLVTTYLDQAVKVWNVADGELKPHRMLDGHTYGAICAAFSPNEDLLAIGCANGHVALWDTRTWQQRAILKCYDNDRSVEAVAFTKDGNTLITGGEDGTVKTHYAASFEEIVEAERKGESPLRRRQTVPSLWENLR